MKAIDALAHSQNQKTFIMPMDMAGLAGTLAGIAEVARGATGEGAGNRASQQTRSASLPPAGRS